MPNLKDFLTLDVDRTFFNTNEFAEIAVIDSKEMTVVIDDVTLEKHNLQKGEGLNTGKLFFSVRKSEFTDEPIIENSMIFNGKRYKILDFTEDAQTYKITLEDRRS
ncbi:hypothetical protein [Cytobacillus firmus]|uniref:hypothetical protein n=1 Tax=Cytobacillus firmus TaxID=1399 RepID=UPI0018CEB548|nr:hypothetical protein [Cytobacillus firmus]MED1942133.1 hypothetical protein [Cytobacillus firmus]